jgi:prepilin-type N-terminal cleavage/methylation domain-containing protein
MRINIRNIVTRLANRLADQRGTTLVELLMALTIVGLVAASFVPGLALGSTAAGRASQEAVAQALARRQTEYVKSFTYNAAATTYAKIPAPADYAVTVTVDSVSGVDTNLQQITVAVAYKGATVVTVESYKVNR